MRRTVWALLLCLLAVSAGLVWYPYLSAERVSTPFEAAELLQQADTLRVGVYDDNRHPRSDRHYNQALISYVTLLRAKGEE